MYNRHLRRMSFCISRCCVRFPSIVTSVTLPLTSSPKAEVVAIE